MAKINLNVEGAFVGDKPKINLNVEGAFVGDSTQKKNPDQNDMASSGVKPLSDGKEEEGWFTSALMYAPRALKGIPEGSWNKIIDEGIGLTRELFVNLLPDKFVAPKKMSFDEKLRWYESSFAPMVEKQKATIKGNANILDEEGLRLPDPEAFGAALGEQLMQMQRNTNMGGMILNHLSFAESNYQEARQRGIDPTKSYFAGHALALTETLIDKYSGIDKRVDNFVSGKLGKIASDEAIDQIIKLGIKSDAFEESVKTSGGLLKNLLTKGAAPEAISEGIQQIVTTGEKQLFDIYQKATNQVDEQDKDKKGQFGADVFSMQTVRDVANSSFMGGLIGSMGYSLTASGDFNPTIYATLQREYNEKGKQGLSTAIENVKTGITKASEAGKLTPEQYNAALQNVDKIANNVSTFEQNSKIDPYSRYSLFNINENLIPMVSNGISKDLAQMAIPVEMPTAQQIDEDIANGNITTVSFDKVSDIPDSFRSFAEVAEDENGNKIIQFAVPNSVAQAHTDNQMAVQTLMNNPLFAVKSLTDNNRVVTIEDLENIGLGGGQVFPSSSQQLQFKTKFEENRPAIINGLKTINYLKSVANQVKDTGKAPDPTMFNQALSNIGKFNTGDTVFYNNTAHKILGTSPDGQKLKLSGIQEQVDASSDNLKTRKQVEQATEEQVAQAETAPTEPTPTEAPTSQEEMVATPTVEEQVVEPAQKTIGDAVYELTPYVYQGKTGRLQQQSNGLVTFETKDKIYELGNIEDIKDKTLAEWDIVQQEMSTDKNFSVTIDGKQFTNKNQNPFSAITYDENGDAVSVKLQDERGKTKVIKGTRAQLIDAQYKERKILNESTDEQLNEIEQQVTARTEDIGNAEQAPTGGQVKPVEPAFTEKQRERKRAIDEVAKRLAQESDNSKNTKEAIANISASLFKAGINVELLTTQQIKDKYNTNAEQGFFISDKGTIVINKNVVESEWGKTIVFHEGTHPIINIIRNTDPKTFKQLVSAIRDMRSTNPTIDSIIKSIEANPNYKGEFTQNDEIVVETIARIASGKLKLNDIPKTLSQKIKDLINKIGKVLGFKQVIRDNNDVAFVKLANQISDVLNAGRDIAEIVGEANIGKFANTDTQMRVNEVFEGILDQLGISAAKESKKGVTNYGVASALNKYYNEKFEKLAVDDFSENALKIVSDYATDEVIFAMQKFGDKSGKGWYTDDFSNAVDKLSEIYPAIKEKEDVREVANIIIAIASNSTDVSTNLMRVVYGLEQYQKTGKIPSDIGTGKAMAAIATTINRYNRLLETFDNNPVKVKEFLQTIRPISESKQAIVEHLGVGSFAQVLKSDYATNPDWADNEVLPTSIIIFGPKIGAFYSNLSGLGGTPTIDRWCIRTMFRYRGDMRAKVLDVDLNKFIEANNLQGQAKANVLAVAEAHAKEFDRLLGARGAYASLTKEQRNAEMAKYRKGKEIYSKSADVVNDIKDGLTDEIKNKAQFAKDFRTFTKNTFERVQENILESTGEKLDISDIQAILWIYEKNLFGFLGVKQREDATYSSAANRIISSINNGNVSLNDVVNGKAKLADMKLDGIVEEGAMGDQYLINEEDYKNGIDANKGSTNIEVQFSDIDRSERLAPNGKPSNLNEYQYNAVRTPEFKAWFGDWENDPENASKIVDENGEPMVMYHGTSKDKDFDSFKIGDRGAWFSSSPAEASSYASSNDSQKMKYDFDSRKYITTNTSSRVIPVFLNIKNLQKQEDLDSNLLEEYRKAGSKSYRNAQKYLFSAIKYKNKNVEGFAFDTKEAGAAFNYAQVIVLFDGKSIEQKDGTYKWFGNEANVKSAIGSKFSPTNPKIQMSDIDRTYTPEGTVADAGMTMQEREAWKEKNKVNQKQVRNPFVQKAAIALLDGDITLDDYISVVREKQPINPFNEVPMLPSVKDIIGALKNDKLGRAGVVGVNRSFNDGDKVATRLDIPAYEDYDTWVVSIHSQRDGGKDGQILAYGQTAVLNNVEFKTSAKGGIGIATGKEKNTIARMWGEWKNEQPESVHRRAQDLINDPNWVQVGMNPFRHSFFYDKSNGEPLLGADEVIQVGALVLARNVKRAPIGSEAFKNAFSFENRLGQIIQFSDVSRDDARINALRNEYYNNDVNADVLVEAAMKEYGLDRDAAEMLVSKATGSVLDLAPYASDNKADLSDEQLTPEMEQVLEEYSRGHKKDKADKLNKEKKKTTFADLAVKLYDSKFKIRRILQSLSDVQTLSSAKLRNIMGKAKASSMEAQKAIADIYGGMSEKQIEVFDELVFALGVIQKDKNNNEKVYKEYDRLRKQFVKENNGKVPNEKQLEDLMVEARKAVPELHHGLLSDRTEYTAKSAQNFIDSARKNYSTEDFDNLMARAAAYKKIGNESIAKMEKAGIISKEVADKFKDDFYSFRKTLDRYYDDYSSNIPIYYKDGVAYYSAFKALGTGSRESYFQRDSRVLLAENILIVNKAIAKNDLRKSIFNDIMSNPADFFVNGTSKQSVIVNKDGGSLAFAFQPAKYTRNTDGSVKQDVSGYIVEPADEGFVNVPFRVDGKLQYFQMAKELYDEVEGLNAVFNPKESGLGLYYDVSNVFNMALTASQTRYNPLFFWRNMSMDIRHQVHFTDYWTSDKNWLKSNVYSAYTRLLFKSIANTKKIFSNDPEMVKLLEEATEVGLFMDTYSEAREQIKRSEEIDTYSVVGKKRSKWDRIKGGVAAMNVKTEIAMRVSAYEQAKKFLTEQYKKMHNVTELSENQIEEIKEIASAQARGYTDFAQKGTLTPQLNYAYLNASIQGLGSAIEYSVDNPEKALRKTSEVFVGHMIWTTMLMMAIPDLYDELDEYTKDVYMLSPTGFLMSKIKDSLGIPASFIPASKIDPTLVPIMGVARRTAEHIVRSMRGEKTEPITYEETARLINIALPSIFNIPEKTMPVDIAMDWGSKILSGSALGSFGTKLLFGYDAFRGRFIDSKNLQGGSNLLDGMHDPDIPYIYKVLAKGAALATDNPDYQVSPARLSAASESVFGSPKSSFLTGVVTAVVSDLANIIIPASEIEKSDITTFNPKTVLKSFGVITDSGIKERLQNKKLLEESHKLNLKAADIETIADKNIDLFYKQNPATLMERVEKYAEEWEYAEDEEATERLLKKAELKFEKLERKSAIPKDLSSEVKIIYYTKGVDNQAKMLKSIAGDDKRMANRIIESLYSFGMDEGKIIEIEDKYLQK